MVFHSSSEETQAKKKKRNSLVKDPQFLRLELSHLIKLTVAEARGRWGATSVHPNQPLTGSFWIPRGDSGPQRRQDLTLSNVTAAAAARACCFLGDGFNDACEAANEEVEASEIGNEHISRR